MSLQELSQSTFDSPFISRYLSFNSNLGMPRLVVGSLLEREMIPLSKSAPTHQSQRRHRLVLLHSLPAIERAFSTCDPRNANNPYM